MSQNRPMSYSYLLAITLLLLIQKSGGPIYERLNLADIAISQIKALTDTNTDKEHISKITDMEDDIKVIRDGYSSGMETRSENSDLYIEERTVIERKLYNVITKIFTIIGAEKLINDKTYGEVIAQSWL